MKWRQMPTRYQKYKDTYQKYRRNNLDRVRNLQRLDDDIRHFDGKRLEALKRDGFCCVMCGIANEQHISIFGRELGIHHKDGNGRNSPEANNNIDNLETICLRCHCKLHKPALKQEREEETKTISPRLYHGTRIRGYKKIKRYELKNRRVNP
jgi:hypothetical protein